MESTPEARTPARDPTQSSPCAGCKFLRRKCQTNCVFAPYFPSNQAQKFIDVHRVFGASNLTKILNDLHPSLRDDAAKSLVYEAQMRLQDPVYGCVGVILVLEDRLQRLKFELLAACEELARLEMATGMRTVGMEELVFPDWLVEQQRMMMMVMMTSGGGHDFGLAATVNGGGAGGGDDRWLPRGTKIEYLNFCDSGVRLCLGRLSFAVEKKKSANGGWDPANIAQNFDSRT